MSQTDKIKIEKITFLEDYSEKFYNELFNKDENNHSILFLITNLLLKEERLEDCEEYSFLNKVVEQEEKSKLEHSLLCNILGTITQFLTRIGSEENVNIILTYFKFNQKREFEPAKILCLA